MNPEIITNTKFHSYKVVALDSIWISQHHPQGRWGRNFEIDCENQVASLMNWVHIKFIWKLLKHVKLRCLPPPPPPRSVCGVPLKNLKVRLCMPLAILHLHPCTKVYTKKSNRWCKVMRKEKKKRYLKSLCLASTIRECYQNLSSKRRWIIIHS